MRPSEIMRQHLAGQAEQRDASPPARVRELERQQMAKRRATALPKYRPKTHRKRNR